MTKRPLPTSTSTSSLASPSKAKKAKTATTAQRGIDSFFTSPAKVKRKEGEGSRKEPVVLDLDEDGERIERDEEMARRIAREEGNDVEDVRRAEERWKESAKSSSKNGASGVKANTPETHQPTPSLNNDSHLPPSAHPIPSPSKPSLSMTLGTSSSTIAAATTYPSLLPDPLLLPFPLNHPPWPTPTPAPFSFLSHALVSLSSTRSRILILNILTNTLRFLIAYDPASLTSAVYLLSNSLGPPYQPNTELNIGSSILSKALLSTTSLTPSSLRALYATHGDPGDVAYHAKTSLRTLVPPSPLTISSLYSSLLAISLVKGTGAAKRKEEIVRGLLVKAQGEEVRWVYRILCMNLRVGAVRNTLLQAVARAFALSPSPSFQSSPEPDPLYYIPPSLQHSIASIPLPTPKKTKTAKIPPDPARIAATETLLRAEGIVKRTYSQHPNYGHIIEGLLNDGLGKLPTSVPLTVGVPLMPTLGSPMRALEEIYARLGGLPFSAEMKYDGQRAQVHVRVLDDDESEKENSKEKERGLEGVGVVDVADGRKARVRVFSRHLEDMTDKYPDLLSLLSLLLTRDPSLRSFILDAEVVAVDPTTGALGSFQELSNRARKDVRLEDVRVAVGLYVFDLMYLDGQQLLDQPFRARRALLREKFPPFRPGVGTGTAARLEWVESVDSEEGEERVREFWERAVKGKYEGLMVKLLDSGEIEEVVRKEKAGGKRKSGESEEDVPKKEKEKEKVGSRRKPLPATYEPDKRTMAWLKLKKDYVHDIGDSLDLIPIGAWHGNGRKAGWWSPVLLGVWDEARGGPVALCKCMSGFTDAFYKSLNERFPVDSETCSRTPLWEVETGGYRPTVYFKPCEVWETRGADITLSPVSVTAKGLVSPDRGLSLRFPRFMKVRDDKGIEQASPPDLIAQMWRNQEARGGGEGMDEGDLVDAEEQEEEVFEESDEE